MIRLFLIAFFALILPAYAEDVKPVHGIAMHGDLKYPADFKHFDYVNPDAPKGGKLRLSALETFDSFNAYIVKGVPADGIGLIYSTLTEQSSDEPFSEYVALAESIEMPQDRSWIVFNIRPEAKWEDGKTVTAEDVKWTYEALMKDGQPFYKSYYADIAKVEALSDKKVKFTFKGQGNLELPLIVGQIPVLPKHYWTAKGRKFGETTLTPPPGNGPYRIASFQAGRGIVYERVKNWWGENLPVYKGRYNFDTITYDYYRDRDVELEALLGGSSDFRQEYTAKSWATSYNAPVVKDGRVVKKEVKNGLPQGMQAFGFNLRRPAFQDQAVRKAMDYAFDFEFSNRQFAYGAYKRSRSFFSNSEMAAPDGPPSGRVKEILESSKDQLPDSVFATRYEPPKTDGSGNNRANLRMAMKILDDAGYKVGPDKIRINPKTGKPLSLEFLTNAGNGALDRWIHPFIQNLERIGIAATFRVVDVSQYVNRMNAFDYDMTITSFPESLSPGNEQREFWKSDRADLNGSRNSIGIKSPVVDKLVEMIISAPTREELVARCQALDYVLLDSNYVIPNWHIPAWRIAYWNKFSQPEKQAPYALGVADTWWMKQ